MISFLQDRKDIRRKKIIVYFGSSPPVVYPQSD